jgi:hypothetical protein
MRRPGWTASLTRPVGSPSSSIKLHPIDDERSARLIGRFRRATTWRPVERELTQATRLATAASRRRDAASDRLDTFAG